MVDLILIAAMYGVFYIGFRCGKAFGTLGEMFSSIRTRVSDWFD